MSYGAPVPLGFFALIVSPRKKARKATLKDNFALGPEIVRITRAAIDPFAEPYAYSRGEPQYAKLSIWRTGPGDHDGENTKEELVICTLDPEKNYQQTLDLAFSRENDVTFSVSGNYDITLSGYYLPSNHEDDYDLSSGEDDDMIDLIGGAESDDDLDDVDTPRITEIDSDEEEEVEEAPKEALKPEKKLTKAETKKLKRAAEDEAKSKEPKLSKKQLKKLKANSGKALEAGSDSPDKKDTGRKISEKADKMSDEKPEKKEDTPSKRVVSGVTIEDKKIGTGAVATNGKKLGMRYIGKLQNGKTFDSNTSGKPFTFTLGRGEVIKGWDIGLAGMKIGGQRRITIPANLAYGSKNLPGIPANSTLIFDVKLLEIK